MVLRAAAQKVGSLANFPFHRGHRAAVYRVYLGHLAASAASAGLDEVLRRCAVRFLESSPELVRDSPSAAAEQVLPGAPLAHQVPQPLVVLEKVLPLPEILVGVQKTPQVGVRPRRPLVVPLGKAAESVWPLVASL